MLPVSTLREISDESRIKVTHFSNNFRPGITKRELGERMNISTRAFEAGEEIPEKYTCDGEDVSPPLSISDVPGGAESFAIVVDDPDAPGGVFDHWVIWNIPSNKKPISEGVPQSATVEELGGAKQGKNGFGETGYRGPCPPGGPAHRYRFKLYALDMELDMESGLKKADLEREMEGHVVEQCEIVGEYSR